VLLILLPETVRAAEQTSALNVPLAQHRWSQERVTGTVFSRYFTRDRLNRRISYFLSDGGTAQRPLPLAVWIQGSGCASVFGRSGDRITTKAQSLLYEAGRGRVVVLVVEKPGVEFLDSQSDPGDQRTCREVFLKEHTLDRWSEAVVAAVRAAHHLARIDRRKTIVIGASEGGIVAAHVSNIFPSITHVASIGGGGPVHLFDLAEFMRRRNLNAENEVYACWDKIRIDPNSMTKFCWGHTYRELSSFLKTSLIDECLRSKSRLYLVHGTADEANFIAGFDVLRAELAAKGRAAIFERLDGADHGLERPGQEAPAGLLSALQRIVSWYLGSEH
jgi:predicted esterase